MPESNAPAHDQFATVPSGTVICFREHGDPEDPALLLLAGLGEDLTFWPDSMINSLVGRGFRVIAVDNRDVGQSSFATTPAPSLWRQVLARPRGDAYSLSDMARDAVGVLEQLGIGQVHLVGRSMGAMIAQTIAATQPERVLSLTSIYSTTGARKSGRPALSTMALLVAPQPRNRTAAVRAHLKITRHIAGAAYPIDDAAEAAIAARGWDRSSGDIGAGVARQIQAIQRSGDRTAQLRQITAPTLVINGDRDLMVDPSGGAATAATIPSAQHVVIPGMGHHLPESLVSPITEYVAQHAARVSEGGSNVEVS
ncbi:alpha/beta fold hydrolase [Epidermidibacterium keratini]|uniref:Alpha/beta fold hydrolase n=1 Tax=Epidermidibacterium keratini TaxID=1891644 RepID=A0A7L4YK71_9ACTN|nr:alpha/beta hydrolase [Epidermidibacterium keratini]QHB99198.1 alpha/beta fold hydrolase [Epidermidibacterium keratini]